VAFSDPPGEYVPTQSESLVPSNSPDSTDGVAIYGAYTYNKYRYHVALGAVCVLPSLKHALCTAVLDQFLASQTQRFPGLGTA
jgi:hypothetical protein